MYRNKLQKLRTALLYSWYFRDFFRSMTPLQLSVSAFNTYPSYACCCDQEPGLPKSNKKQRMHLGKHCRRSTVGQDQWALPSTWGLGGHRSCQNSASSWPSLAMVYCWFFFASILLHLAGAFSGKMSDFRQRSNLKICLPFSVTWPSFTRTGRICLSK